MTKCTLGANVPIWYCVFLFSTYFICFIYYSKCEKSANQEDRISRLITSVTLRGELQNYKTIVRHLFIDNNWDSERFADNNKPDKPELDVDDDVNITNDL